MDPLLYATPTHVERNICRYRRAILQGIHNIVIVFDIYIVDYHRGRCVIEVDFYTLIGDAYCPEQAARSNTGIEVVDLILRGKLPLIEIQSNEAESSLVLFPIQSNVDSLHEAHVSIEVKGSSNTSLRVCSCTRPVDNSGSN